MKPNMRSNFSGTFMARDVGRGSWRLSGRESAPPIDILLKVVQGGTADAFGPHAVSDIELEWQDGAVLMSLTSSQRRTSIKLQSAIVHQPLARLYDALPLAEFDGKARRFWRWVFALVRIPGGRYLLDAVARRTRSGV
jgi:hypothetical protein